MPLLESILKAIPIPTDELYKLKTVLGGIILCGCLGGIPFLWHNTIVKSYDIQAKSDQLKVEVKRFETNFTLWQDAAKGQAQLEYLIGMKKTFGSTDPLTEQQKSSLLAEAKEIAKSPNSKNPAPEAIVEAYENLRIMLRNSGSIEKLQEQLDFINETLNQFKKEAVSFVDLGYRIDAKKNEIASEEALLGYYRTMSVALTVLGLGLLWLGIWLIKSGSRDWRASKDKTDKPKLILPPN